MYAPAPPRPVRALGLVACALSIATLVGCARPPAACPDGDAVTVDVSAAEDPEGAETAVREILATFAEWTGGAETCVTRITVVPEIPRVSGYFAGGGRRIRVEERTLATILPHELCHALDRALGHGAVRASDTAPGLLAPYGPVDADTPLDPANPTDPASAERILTEYNYPGDRARTHEGFARICAAGPESLATVLLLGETCGADAWPDDVAAAAFVYAAAFGDPADAREATGWEPLGDPLPAEATTVPLPALPPDVFSLGVSAVAGAGGLYVRARGYAGDFDAPTSIERLWLLDPVTFAVLDTLELPAPMLGEPDGWVDPGDHALLGSTGDPLLYASQGDDAGRAWRIRTDPLRLDPVALPGLDPYEWVTGFERDGVVLLQQGSAAPPARLDLATGTLLPLAPVVPPGVDTSRAAGFYADADGAVVAYPSDGGLTVVTVDWTGAATSARALPLPTYGLRGLVRLPDGAVIAAPSVTKDLGLDASANTAVSLRYDRAADTWSLAGGCWHFAGDGWAPTPTGVARPSVTVDADQYVASLLLLGM